MHFSQQDSKDVPLSLVRSRESFTSYIRVGGIDTEARVYVIPKITMSSDDVFNPHFFPFPKASIPRNARGVVF